MPARSANSIASDDGADTPATSGSRAASAFCTISNEIRPDTSSTWPASGQRFSRRQKPSTLSTALCRPTSSRATSSVPVRDRTAPPRGDRPCARSRAARPRAAPAAAGTAPRRSARDRGSAARTRARSRSSPCRTRRSCCSRRGCGAAPPSRRAPPPRARRAPRCRPLRGCAPRGSGAPTARPRSRRSRARSTGSRARDRRRGPACASPPRAASRRSGSRAAPRAPPRRGRARGACAPKRTTPTSAIESQRRRDLRITGPAIRRSRGVKTAVNGARLPSARAVGERARRPPARVARRRADPLDDRSPRGQRAVLGPVHVLPGAHRETRARGSCSAGSTDRIARGSRSCSPRRSRARPTGTPAATPFWSARPCAPRPRSRCGCAGACSARCTRPTSRSRS